MIRIAFLLGSGMIIIGAWAKIVHLPYANVLLGIGLAAIILSTVLSLYEIHSSSRIKTLEKVVWTLGFVLMNWITGLVYILAGRKRV